MARLLETEITAQLFELRQLDKKEKIYKTQLDELENQHKRILLQGLCGKSYFKLSKGG